MKASAMMQVDSNESHVIGIGSIEIHSYTPSQCLDLSMSRLQKSELRYGPEAVMSI
jgi:hypothetical protein